MEGWTTRSNRQRVIAASMSASTAQPELSPSPEGRYSPPPDNRRVLAPEFELVPKG